MKIHGCFITSEPTDLGPDRATQDGPLLHDGFLTTCKGPDGTIYGPFNTVRDAMRCAEELNDKEAEVAKAKLQAVADAAPTTSPIQLPVENNAVETPNQAVNVAKNNAQTTESQSSEAATDVPKTKETK